jgi:hypothetical protein
LRGFGQVLVIFDQQNPASTHPLTLNGIRSLGGLIHDAVAGARQVQPYSGPNPRLAVDADMASGLFYKPKDHAEAKSGAFADGLGCKEWVEGPLNHFRGHACAGVGDADAYIFTGLELAELLDIVRMESCIPCLDHQLSAVGHGVSRVGGEVGYRGLQLSGVNHRRPHVVFGFQHDLDVFTQGPG